ncbi:MAG: parallel beta-helix domain-containing protein [Planctomycetota bacterium]|jgi:parallel beta-helix repeat protein
MKSDSWSKGILVFCALPILMEASGIAQDALSPARVAPATGRSVVTIATGEDAQHRLQSALILAAPGDVIQLEEGIYRFDSELNVTCSNLTIQGVGRDRTVLSFRGQVAGAGGILGTGNGLTIQDLSVEDTSGNAIKTLGARDVTFRRVRVEWTDGPQSTNGAYGLYPVECRNVLIEDCVAVGASDAGIYVGQSQDVIVRGCRAEKNVAGIEIENSLHADVYDNVATNNTGGILVFDLPGLTLTNGGQVRIFRNRVEGNNHKNFAQPGAIVGEVPPGTGVMLMSTDHVEIFDNDIADHQTSNVVIVSYLITERKLNDKKYDPYPEAFSLHDNRISGGGKKPSGKIGKMLAPVVGIPFPDIFFDGIQDKKKLVDGELPRELRGRIREAETTTFANVHIDNFSPANVLSGRYKIDRKADSLNGEPSPIEPVVLQPHAMSPSESLEAVSVYRRAPVRLSQWDLFEMKESRWVRASSTIPYELNTSLYSDDTIKHRWFRLPQGTAIRWTEHGSLDFPVGTVIAKTFAYPDPVDDATPGERYLETRLELREPSGWYGYSYVWNEDQTDAELRLGGGRIDASWTDASGTRQTNRYEVPNANQCLTCHSQSDKYEPLGPTARNVNRRWSSQEAHSQLVQWIREGILVGAPEPAEHPTLARFDDPQTGTLDQRARAWLEVNCAHCHNPAGSARTSGLDLSVGQSDPARWGVMKSPVAAGKGSGGRKYDIVPGKPDESILMYRLEIEDVGARMPNLARNRTFDAGNALIRDWIAGLKESADASGPK